MNFNILHKTSENNLTVVIRIRAMKIKKNEAWKIALYVKQAVLKWSLTIFTSFPISSSSYLAK